MNGTGVQRVSLVLLIITSIVVLLSPISIANVGLKVDWRSGDDALTQTVDTMFSGWAGISLQDVLRDTSLFSISLENNGSEDEQVYLTLGLEADFDNPNYADFGDVEFRFESITLPAGVTRTFGAGSVDIDVDELVSDIGSVLVELEEGEDPELPDYLEDVTRGDIFRGDWPDIVEETGPFLDGAQLAALGISLAGEVVRTRQLPAGTYTMIVTLYRDVSGSWIQADQASLTIVVKTPSDLKVVSPVEGQLVADGAPTFQWSVPKELVGYADLEFAVTVKPIGSSDAVLVGTLDLSQVSALGAATLEYSDLAEPLDPGSYTWTLTAVDRTKSDVLETEGILFGRPIVTGFRVNSPPQVAISQQYVVQGSVGDVILEGDTVTFSGAASDLEDGVIAPSSLIWSVDDDPVGAGASLTYTFESPGLYTLQLSAVDSMGAEETDTLSVAVTENSPPVITSFTPDLDVEITEGDVVSFYARASDPDRPGQANVTYVWSVEGIDYGFSPAFSFVFGSLSGFGASDEPYVVTLTVYDDLGATATHDVTVTVAESAGGTGIPGGPSDDDDDLIREIVDLTGEAGGGPSLGQELFGFIPSFAGMAVVVQDDLDELDEDVDDADDADDADDGEGGEGEGGKGGKGGTPTGSRTVIYVSSPRNGEVRYSTEMIPFIASADVLWALDYLDNVIGRGRHFQTLDPGDHVVYVLRPLPSGETEAIAEIHVPVESEPETLATVGMMQIASAEDAVYVGTPSQSAGSTGLYWERPAVPGMRLVLMQRVRVEGEASVDVVYDDGLVVSMPSMANPHVVDPLDASLLEGGV